MIDAMKEFLNDYKYIIIVIVSLLFTSICLINQKDATLSNIGQSLLVNMATTALTVFVIDRLYKNIENRKKIPLEYTAYSALALWCNQFISFWQDAYRYCGYYAPITDKGIFLEDEFKRMYITLRLDGIPNVVPRTTWQSLIILKNKEMTDNAKEILMKHSYYLPPEICKQLHQLLDTPFIYTMSMIATIKQVDVQYKISRTNVLASYSYIPKQEDLDMFLRIHTWCIFKHNELKKEFQSIRGISKLL